MRVPILPHAKCRSWPKHDQGARAVYLDIGAALTRRYTTDAHFTQYHCPTVERRLCLAAPEALGHSVSMVAHLFDIDGEGHVGTDDWWQGERGKIASLFAVHPGGYAYRTRGGYRLVYLRRKQFEILTADDAARWRRTVLVSIAYLERRFGIAGGDTACLEWVRLFRLPHATRDPFGFPEDLETIGDATNIGAWVPEILDEDRAIARKLSSKRMTRVFEPAEPTSDYRGAGLLYAVMSARGWIGREIQTGMWLARCPNERNHTVASGADATVLYAADRGGQLGHICCLHQHCEDFRPKDWLRFFDDAELDAARRAAGILRHPHAPPGKVTSAGEHGAHGAPT